MFLYTEKLNLVRESNTSIENKICNKKTAILGVGFDSTETNLAGQRKAPNSIRNALLSIETNNLLEDRMVADIGNLIVVEGNASKTIDRLEQTIDDLFNCSSNIIPILLGGEHTITLGAIKSIKKKYRDFDILCFDAHYDLMDNWQTEKINHSTVMRRIWELNKNLAFIGAREYAKEEEAFFKKNNIGKNYDKIKNSKNPLYISIDVDAFDPSIMPGVSDSVYGGITIKQFFDILKLFKERKIIGIDIVEFNPIIEEHITSRNIANIIIKLIEFGL